MPTCQVLQRRVLLARVQRHWGRVSQQLALDIQQGTLSGSEHIQPLRDHGRWSLVSL